jgi:hypothetical protein
MEELTWTELMARMEATMAQADLSPEAMLETLRAQNVIMAEVAQLLATTAREVAAIHAEASRGFAGAMHLLNSLITRLEGSR